MKSTSFRDILAQFLEEKSTSSVDSDSSKTPISPFAHSQMFEIPFVFLDTRRPTARPRHTPYVTTPPVPKVKVTPQLNRSMLPPHAQEALDTLLRLGASELSDDLSSDVIKKAYRRLLKFYHPDHYPLSLLPEEHKRRVEQFWALRKAHGELILALSQVDTAT